MLKSKQLRINIPSIYRVVNLSHNIYSPMNLFRFDDVRPIWDCPRAQPSTALFAKEMAFKLNPLHYR